MQRIGQIHVPQNVFLVSLGDYTRKKGHYKKSQRDYHHHHRHFICYLFNAADALDRL